MLPDNENIQSNNLKPANSDRIYITTTAALEEQDRDYTRNMSHDQRMAYLQILISITHSEADLKALEKIIMEGRIRIKKPL